jgi:hypothetical protein
MQLKVYRQEDWTVLVHSTFSFLSVFVYVDKDKELNLPMNFTR